MQKGDPEIVRFGVFELNLAAGELRKQGVRIKLQDQPLQILRLLLERPGGIVSRDEIRQALWPADTFVDFDRSLNTAVNKLREALGDSAHSPRFVETVPRRGYRFVAGVERAEASARNTIRLSVLRPGVVLSVIAALALSSWAVWRWERGRSQPLQIEPRPLTSYPGTETQPSFSPGGGQFAFVWNGDRQDNFDVYVRAVTAEHPLRLTTDPEPDLSPAWSPRGDVIAFLRSHGDSASVKIAPASGGPERHLTRIRVPVAHIAPTQLAWLPDGQSLVMPDEQADGKPTALFIWSLKTGQRHQLTFPPPDSPGDLSPSVSPDGRHVLFSRGQGSNPRLYRASFDSPREATEVSFDEVKPRSGIWSAGAGDIVAVAGVQHWNGLWLFSAAAEHSPVPLVKHPAGQPAMPVSIRRLAYSRFDWDANIWKVSLNGGSRSPRPFITSSYVDHLPDFSPDGGRIVFVSSRSGAQELYLCDRHGGGIQKLTTLGTGGSPRWSPGGDRIAYSALNEDHRGEIYLINPDGSGIERLTEHPAVDIAPSWSGNGEWIYFGSNRAGPFDIWKVRRSGGEPKRITYQGGFHALESNDGRYLYYAKTNQETSLWRVPKEGGQEEEVLPSLSN